MGASTLDGMLDAVEEGLLTLTAALRWHLRHNLYPPPPEWMAEHAERAINYVRSGQPDHPVYLLAPQGRGFAEMIVGDRSTRHPAARHLVKVLHLDAFTQPAEEV